MRVKPAVLASLAILGMTQKVVAPDPFSRGEVTNGLYQATTGSFRVEFSNKMLPKFV